MKADTDLRRGARARAGQLEALCLTQVNKGARCASRRWALAEVGLEPGTSGFEDNANDGCATSAGARVAEPARASRAREPPQHAWRHAPPGREHHRVNHTRVKHVEQAQHVQHVQHVEHVEHEAQGALGAAGFYTGDSVAGSAAGNQRLCGRLFGQCPSPHPLSVARVRERVTG